MSSQYFRVCLEIQSNNKPKNNVFSSTGLTLDIISKCAFSIDTDAVKNPDDEILKHGRGVFASFAPTNWLETLMFLIPTAYFPSVLHYISLFSESQAWMYKLTKNIMKVPHFSLRSSETILSH